MYDVYTTTATFESLGHPPARPTLSAPSRGPQLLDVKETNGTSTSEVQRIFIIDTTGPSITATTPAPGIVVGGVVVVSATVKDPAGVLDASVIAIIGDDHGTPVFTLQLEPAGERRLRHALRHAQPHAVQPTPPEPLSASSTRRSRSAPPTRSATRASLGYEFSVDNIAPVADLDPPKMRQIASDREGVRVLGAVRSAQRQPATSATCPTTDAWCRRCSTCAPASRTTATAPTGLKVTPIAGIDPDKTNVYILTDDGQPLIVDSDGDGYCDDDQPEPGPHHRPAHPEQSGPARSAWRA